MDASTGDRMPRERAAEAAERARKAEERSIELQCRALALERIEQAIERAIEARATPPMQKRSAFIWTRCSFTNSTRATSERTAMRNVPERPNDEPRRLASEWRERTGSGSGSESETRRLSAASSAHLTLRLQPDGAPTARLHQPSWLAFQVVDA